MTALAVLVTVVTVPAGAAPVAASLTVTPITWNVIGLDSNRPATDGPDTFPIGARICNTGNVSAAELTSSFVFDSVSTAISVIGPSRLTFDELAAGACTDAYYNVVVTRAVGSFNQGRAYRITASATGVAQASTPAGRELYVEKLVSQARNEVKGISGTAVQVSPTATSPGRATVVVGQTYTFTVESATAPGGYEQLESFLNFPTTIFRILSVDASYAEPVDATNDTIYADACGWDNAVSADRRSTYRSCIGPVQYGSGKVGGDPILTTYTVKVVSAGTGELGTLIYDFSGSSFHYNADFGTDITSVEFAAVDPSASADLAIAKSHSGNFTRGVNGTYTLSVTNVGGSASTGTTTVTDALPAGLQYVAASGTGWTCGHASGTVTCTTADPVAAGATAAPITLTVLPTAGGAVTNSASVANTSDAKGANDTSSDPTIVDRLPVADDDATTTNEDVAIAVAVLDGDDLGDGPTTITGFGQGGHGAVSCSTTQCTYTPSSNRNGTDTFTYTITGDDGDPSTATVTVDVSAVNDPPVAEDDDRTTPTGTSIAIPVLDNDQDIDGGTLVVTTPTPTAAHGIVSCTASACTYTPNAGHAGVDTFTYAISDGRTGTDAATVTITTSAAPADLAMTKLHTGALTEGAPATYTLTVANTGGSAATSTTTVTDVLPTGLVFIGATGTGWSCAHVTGTVTCTTSGAIAAAATAPVITLTVTPTMGGTVTNTASVDNSDDANAVNDSDSDVATVDALPDADDDSTTTAEDTAVDIDVLSGDDLGDGPTTVTAHGQGAHGAVSCTATRCTYTPAGNASGIDTFDYTITDADGDTSEATVTVDVTPVNDPPVARADTASAAAGTDVTIDVLENDDDVDGGTLVITTPAPGASHGTVSCSATRCTYTPAPGHAGADTFTYGISDGNGGTDTAAVTVTTTSTPAPTTDPDPTPATATAVPAPTTTPSLPVPDDEGVAATTGAVAAAPAPTETLPAIAAEATPAAAGSATAVPPERGMLPRTGGALLSLTLAGLGLLAAGSALVTGSRRRGGLA